MDGTIAVRLIVGLGMTFLTVFFAAQRVQFLVKLITHGQPVSGRATDLGKRVALQFVEVFGQKKLLKWNVSGAAHFFTFWGFVILGSVYVEAYGALFDEDFSIPIVGESDILGFAQDFIACAVVVSLGVFAILRIRNAPQRRQRDSRFYGSHTGGAWLILFMIFNVIWTMFLFRGAGWNTGHLPYGDGAFASHLAGTILDPLGHDANEVLDTVGLLLHIGVMLSFLLIVLHSKHLHIFVAPINVSAKRIPKALGPLLPMEYAGKPIDFEDPDEDATFGRGKIEDFTWKGMLDFATCTECGRCQSQCPAWNTGKPLSPKLVIMDLRDHLFAKAPYLIGGKDEIEVGSVEIEVDEHHRHGVPESGFGRVEGSGEEQASRPLVGTLEAGGVIDPDVLWSCTTCGACVEQCPVDIEHVDHIVDMRRYQVLIETEFPSELGTMFKNLENKGNPWGQNNSERMSWTNGLDFEVPVLEEETLPDEVEYLFWIGCAGSFDDNAKKTVRATAELLHLAGVNYRVLGDGETCTGDSARRAGNEFLFQMLAQQNVEVLNTVFEGRQAGRRKIVTTCPHCFNTIGREYPQLEGHYEVVHHTQLLNQLVRDKRLVPVTVTDGAGPEVTYHDPCYLGRHNEIYTPPRELVGAAGAKLKEMPRHADRAMCCGAGGARMWMEEHIGKRVNLERVDEAIATETTKVATGCPFCRVMMTDGLTTRTSEDANGKMEEVLDVAQLLLTSVKRGLDAMPDLDRPGDPEAAAAFTAAAAPAAPAKESAAETPAEPEPEAASAPAPEKTAEPAEAEAEPAAAETEDEEQPAASAAAPAAPAAPAAKKPRKKVSFSYASDGAPEPPAEEASAPAPEKTEEPKQEAPKEEVPRAAEPEPEPAAAEADEAPKAAAAPAPAKKPRKKVSFSYASDGAPEPPAAEGDAKPAAPTEKAAEPEKTSEPEAKAEPEEPKSEEPKSEEPTEEAPETEEPKDEPKAEEPKAAAAAPAPVAKKPRKKVTFSYSSDGAPEPPAAEGDTKPAAPADKAPEPEKTPEPEAKAEPVEPKAEEPKAEDPEPEPEPEKAEAATEPEAEAEPAEEPDAGSDSDGPEPAKPAAAAPAPAAKKPRRKVSFSYNSDD